MTTPTREQVIEWAKEAGLLNRAAFNHETDLYRLCNLAFEAGRDQGLREAAELMRELGRLLKGNATPTTEEAALVIESLLKRAAAIEQLRGK